MGNSKSLSYHDLLSFREMPANVRELHYAVMSHDKDQVNHLVAEGVNVNFPWYNPSNPSVKDGNTALICAVSLNFTDIVEILLRAGAYINKCDRNGCTPVYKASFHGRPALIELLSRTGADVNLADFYGKTPLYMCVNNSIVHTSSSKLAVQKLLSAGAIVDKPDKTGQAPIHSAAHWKLAAIMQMLLAVKSDCNLVDHKGRTPLYICVSSLSTKLYAEDLRHQLPCILILFHAGADMLNLIEWLLVKGPGIPIYLLKELCSVEFRAWYAMQISRPQTLKSLSRKAIQKALSAHQYGAIVEMLRKLPLPASLKRYVSRKMFFREPHRPLS